MGSFIETTGRTTRMIGKLLFATLLVGAAMAQEYDETHLTEGEGRFLYFNTSSTATSLTLLGALILVGVIFYLVYAGGLLEPLRRSGTEYNRNDYYNQYDQYNHARSASDGYDFNGLNVIQWISMLQEVYEKFDYNDIDCQKRLICEVMQDTDYFEGVSRKLKTGFQFAKYLEVLNLPDDFREILDEYIDASERSLAHKGCGEVFECPFSLSDSMKRTFSGNAL